MVKKFGIILLVIALILGIITPLESVYAGENFFEINNQEIEKDGTAKLIINLNKIQYNKFKLTLISDETLENISTNEQVEVEQNDNEICIEINKENTNLSKITLDYKVPEEKEVGDVITFIANVINLDNEEENLSEQKQITIVEAKEEEKQEDEAKENKQEQQNDKGSAQNQEVKEQKSDDENQNQKTMQDDKTKQITSENSKSTNGKQNSSANKSTTASISSSGNMQSSTKSQTKATETVTYNGSNNNYLSSLSVKGYSLNKDFSKDSNTYFVTVEKSISSVTVNTNQEDSTATVNIYGNENLKTGVNKILVNVTAENGNVRTYRIYVTIKA